MYVSARAKLLGFLLAAILVSMSYVYISQLTDSLTNKIYLHTAKTMQDDIQEELSSKSQDVLILSVALGATQDIKKLFNKKKKTYPDFDDISLQLTKYSLFEDITFKVLRVNAQEKPLIEKPVVYLELPKNEDSLAFKSIIPIYINGSMEGYFSAKAIFDSISSNIHAKKYNAVIVVNDAKKFYVTNPFYNKNLIDVAYRMSKTELESINKYKVDKKNGILITTLKLDNINGTTQGYVLLAKDLKEIDMSSVAREKDKTILVFTLLILAFFILLYYVYMVNYKKSIEFYSDELEKDLENKSLELEKQADVLRFIAHNDPLTGLPNKLALIDKLQASIDNAKINDYRVGILFMDLDKFKEINDTYGHEIGDILLKQVASRLKECIKQTTVLSRLSGDEFVIIDDKMTDTGISNLTEKILLEMKKQFLIQNQDIYITFSIGLSIYPKDGDTTAILLGNAETAMYASKNFAKNNYKFYDESMTKFSKKRMELDLNIRAALRNKEFEPYYQPKMNAVTNKVIGIEALIRWNDGENGVVSPAQFIPFCEETGLVIDIDRFMLVESIRQVAKWQSIGIKTGKLSVNISAKKLESPNFISQLKQIMLSENFNPKDLELEILEGQIMKDPENSIKILQSLRDLGISISIDDFGTGYSSLSYLNKLPITRLKIDRSFIIDVPENEYDVTLVRTIIAMATNLSLDIITEGVETKEQVDFLVEEGCENIQGYYFSKPLCAEDLKEYLIENS
ncbi:EAL domain-containing protein [Sulfurimonas sp.]|uniref:putative bifunctional diguanylate cyclase/phosphodiesterase n=1 Tax=Sulfurimonas sp. TaxID=2022749 RepID=UPI002603D83C|nr:EAL domain-containing protein [Sulfurimonas sp.]